MAVGSAYPSPDEPHAEIRGRGDASSRRIGRAPGSPPALARDLSTDTSALPERLRAGCEVAGLASALAEGVPIRTLAGAWLVRKVLFATMNMPPNSGNRLLVFGCECNVNDTHRNSAAEGGQLSGLPEERMPVGLVLIHGRAHGARIAAQPAEAVGARCKPPGQIPGLAAANAAAASR